MFNQVDSLFSGQPNDRSKTNVLNWLSGKTKNTWVKTGGAQTNRNGFEQQQRAGVPGFNVLNAIFSSAKHPSYKPVNMSRAPINMTPTLQSLPRNYQMLVEAGVSRPHRNNNPLNIKASEYTRGYSGVVNIDPYTAADGGHFLIFDNIKSGFDAAKRLLSTEGYMRLNVDQALKRWSNNGYGGEILPNIKNKMMAALTEAEKDILVRTMARREGYKGA